MRLLLRLRLRRWLTLVVGMAVTWQLALLLMFHNRPSFRTHPTHSPPATTATTATTPPPPPPPPRLRPLHIAAGNHRAAQDAINPGASAAKACMALDKGGGSQHAHHAPSDFTQHQLALGALAAGGATQRKAPALGEAQGAWDGAAVVVFAVDVPLDVVDVVSNLSDAVGGRVVVVVPRVAGEWWRLLALAHEPQDAQHSGEGDAAGAWGGVGGSGRSMSSEVVSIVLDLGEGGAVVMVDTAQRIPPLRRPLGTPPPDPLAAPPHDTHPAAAGVRLALLEVSDVMLTLDGEDYRLAEGMGVPVVVLFTDQRLGARGATLPALPPPELAAQVASHVSATFPRPRVAVCVHSYLNPFGGYGRSAVDLARQLHWDMASGRLQLPSQGAQFRVNALNVSLAFVVVGGTPEDNSWRSEVGPEVLAMLALGEVPTLRCHTYIGYFVPHEHPVVHLHPAARTSLRRLVYTTFETTKVPSRWPRLLNRFDALLVSCAALARVFRDCGVTVPIHVVPLGVDSSKWPLAHRDPQQHAERFQFLLFADGEWTNHRKNFELALQAFVRAFTEQGVEVIAHRMGTSELVALLHESSCLVFPSHGEGYGLPPREAMSTGAPVLLAGFLGLASIANKSMNFPLRFTMERASGYDVWLPENNNSTDFGEWAAVSAHELARAMREAQSDTEDLINRGLRAAEFVRAHETYHHSMSALYPVLWAPTT